MADETMFDQVTENQPDRVEDLNFTVSPEYRQYIEQYVGEGKKYPNIGELAKAYANADRHIPELAADINKVKQERDSLKDLLMNNLINDTNNVDDPNANTNDAAPPAQPPEAAPHSKADTDVDISKLINDALTEREILQKKQNNAKLTEEVMLKRYGNKEDAIAAVQAKAAELEVSPQFIANLAFDSPAAYFDLMGLDPKSATPKSTSTPAPRSDVNPQRMSEANPHVKEGTYQWYSELRRSNPAKFRSQEIQNRMMKDAEANPNFFS